MAATSVFQIALIDRVYPKLDYFDFSAKNTVTYTLWEHLIAIARATPGRFIPSPAWSFRAEHVQAHDVVIYFVNEPSQSVARRKLGIEPLSGANGGFTTFSSKGAVSEVYVEGNMPARRLANIAFHELMHNKLKMGNEMHAHGGLAGTPTSEHAILSDLNIRRMSAALLHRVPQYTGAM